MSNRAYRIWDLVWCLASEIERIRAVEKITDLIQGKLSQIMELFFGAISYILKFVAATQVRNFLEQIFHKLGSLSAAKVLFDS